MKCIGAGEWELQLIFSSPLPYFSALRDLDEFSSTSNSWALALNILPNIWVLSQIIISHTIVKTFIIICYIFCKYNYAGENV